MSQILQLDQWMDQLDPALLKDIAVEERTMTEQEIHRIQKKALGKIRRPRWGKKQAALLAVAALAITGATAAAAGRLAGGELFSRYFGGEDLQPGWLEKMCASPVASAQADGYAVELLGVMGDRHSFSVIMDVTAPEGEVLSETARFETTRLTFEEEQGGYGAGWFMTQLADDDPQDNKARFMLMGDTSQKVTGKRMTLRLETLQATGEPPQSGTYEESILSDAVWELTFPMEFEDLTRKVRVGQGASWKGEPVEIKSVELSPVSLRVSLGYSLGDLLFDRPAPASGEDGTGEEGTGYSLTLGMKDGTELNLADFCQMAGESRDFAGWTVSWNFSRLVDISQVESVSVMGVEIPVA